MIHALAEGHIVCRVLKRFHFGGFAVIANEDNGNLSGSRQVAK